MKKIIKLLKDNKSIRYEVKENKILIYNLNNNKMIEIDEESEEYIISFATQHRHFENDVEEIKEYLSNIMNDQILPIEFYKNNKNIFGGEITIDLYNNLSNKALADYYGCSEEDISNYEYEIHSWSGKYDIKK